MPSFRTLVAGVSAALVMAMVVPAAAQAQDPLIEDFPVDSTDVRFVADFGVFAKERIHQGIDIMADKGTPIVAVADGFVTRIWRGVRAGYAVAIRHADGWESRYLHLDNDDAGTDNGRGGAGTAYAPGLEEGQFVAAGTIIGFVGDSGNAEDTPPHLHFELRRRSVPRDPYRELVRAFDRRASLAALELLDIPIQ